jgi:hypothetical protein
MNEVKVEFKGDAEMLEALAEYAKKCGLDASLDELIQNSKKASLRHVLTLVGALAAIAQAVARFQGEHKSQIEIVTPRGTLKSQNYTAEDLAKIFNTARTNVFINPVSSSQAPKP